MSSNLQPDPQAQGTDAAHSVQSADISQQFTPEQLRKAARAQVILYVVMAIFIVLPFIVMWLRGSGEAESASAASQENPPAAEASQSSAGAQRSPPAAEAPQSERPQVEASAP